MRRSVIARYSHAPAPLKGDWRTKMCGGLSPAAPVHQSNATKARKRIASATSFPFHCAYLGIICTLWQRLDRCHPGMPMGGDCILGPPRALYAGQARQIWLQRWKQTDSDQSQRVPQQVQVMFSATGQVLLAQLFWTQRSNALGTELQNRHFGGTQKSRKSNYCCRSCFDRFPAVC